MNVDEIKKKAKGLMKNKKTVEVVIAVVIIAIILCLYLSTLGGETPNQTDSNSSGTSSREQGQLELEQKLMDTLSVIAGAGKVKVMVTYESTSEKIPAMDIQTNSMESENKENSSVNRSETTNSKPVTIQEESGTGAMVITEIEPKVRGAIIVAEGAGDVGVKLDLLQAAQTVLNISANRVDVFTMQSND